MLESRILIIADLSFNGFCENIIFAKISQFTVSHWRNDSVSPFKFAGSFSDCIHTQRMVLDEGLYQKFVSLTLYTVPHIEAC